MIEEYLAYKKETRQLTSEDILNSLTDQLNAKDKEFQDEQAKWAEFRKTNNVAVLEAAGKDAGEYLDELDLQLRKLTLERELYNQSLAVQANEEATSDFPIVIAPTVAPVVAATNAIAGSRDQRPSDAALANDEPAVALARSSDIDLRAARLALALKRAERDRAKAGARAGRRPGPRRGGDGSAERRWPCSKCRSKPSNRPAWEITTGASWRSKTRCRP